MKYKIPIIKKNAKHFDDTYILSKINPIHCDNENLIIDYSILKSYLSAINVEIFYADYTNNYGKLFISTVTKKLVDNKIDYEEKEITGDIVLTIKVKNSNNKSTINFNSKTSKFRKYAVRPTIIYFRQNSLDQYKNYNINTLKSCLTSNGRIIINTI